VKTEKLRAGGTSQNDRVAIYACVVRRRLLRRISRRITTTTIPAATKLKSHWKARFMMLTDDQKSLEML
jgi:hypothetical protein